MHSQLRAFTYSASCFCFSHSVFFLFAQAGQYAVFYDAHGACLGCGVILEALAGGQDFHADAQDAHADALSQAGGAAVALLAAAR
jgi:hypothetical protein